jgi:hypothetical protein
MMQKPSLKGMPTKSRDWLEAECLRIARRTIGGIQSVTIRRLHKGARPNWKVADIIPQPSLMVSGKIRDALARLTGIYALED